MPATFMFDPRAQSFGGALFIIIFIFIFFADFILASKQSIARYSAAIRVY